jgi:GntR family transcriptional regulator
MIDRTADRPVYRQLADILRAEIASGARPRGAAMPSPRDLAECFQVGRDTVIDAINVLRAEGLVETFRGQSTRVRPVPRTEVVLLPADFRIRARMPLAEERKRLDLPDGVPVLVVDVNGNQQVYPGDRIELRPEGGEPTARHRLKMPLPHG